MLETTPAEPPRRVEGSSASVAVTADGDFTWEPRPLARAIRSGRRFRWAVVFTALVSAAGLYVGILLGLQYPSAHASDRSAAYRLTTAELSTALAGATEAAAAVTDGAAGADGISAAVAPLLRLEVAASHAQEVAGEWLLVLPRPIPTPYLDDLRAARSSLQRLAGTVDAYAGRLRIVIDYRLGVEQLLALPKLPSPADPFPAAEAERALGDALTAAVSGLGALPDDPLLSAHRDTVARLLVWLGEWQATYLNALHGGDLDAAVMLERRAAARIDDVRLALLEPLAEFEEWAGAIHSSLRRTITEIEILIA